MGRRLVAIGPALLVAYALMGCGSAEKPADPVAATTAGPGVQVHSGRGQINPNAQMPAAGSRAK